MRTIINSKYFKTFQNILESKWLFILAALTTFMFIYYKSIYQSADHLNDVFNLIVLSVLLSLAFIYETKWGTVARVVLVFFLFIAPLYWLWRSGQYDTTAIAGLIPIQDMMQYYSDSLRLHYGFLLSSFSSRRPLFSGFFSVILKATGGDLQVALVVLVIVVVVSAVFLALEIRKTYGSFTAMTVVVLVYYCYKGYGFIGKVMTEQLGLPLGMLALALFLQGLRLKKIYPLLFGLLTLTVALNARAGAFFVIPAVIVWGSFYNPERKFSLRQAALFSAAAGAGFFLNYLVFRWIGNSQGIMFENFGDTLYGLVTGYRGWSSLPHDHPGISGRNVWPLIFEILRRHPENLLFGILRAYMDYLKPETMFRFLYFAPTAQTVVSYLLFGCTVLGIWWLIRKPIDDGFFLWVLLGIFASIPFTPPSDDGIRALTATIPFSVLILGLPFSQSPGDHSPRLDGARSLYGFTSGLLILTILGPWLIRLNPEPLPKIDPVVCPAGTSFVALWVAPGSFVRVVKDETISYSLVPDVRVHDLRGSTAKNPLDFLSSISPIIRRMKAGQSILASLNLYGISQESNAVMLIAPTELVRIGRINRFCARHLTTDAYGMIPLYLEQSLDPAGLIGR